MIEPILLTLVLVGGWISYYDIRKGEIKNYSILVLILAAIFINVFLTKTFVDQTLASTINIFFGILAAIIIWLAGLWSAADAKLFIALVALFPITFYTHSISYFPGFAIFINSFIPLFLILAPQIILKTSLKEKKQTLNQLLSHRFILHFLLVVLAISCISLLISQVLSIRIEYFIWLLLLFIFFWFIEEVLKIRLVFFFISVTLFTIVFFPLQLFTPSFFLRFSIFSLLIFCLFFIIYLGRSAFTQITGIKDLKAGMIPAEMIVKEKEKYIKRPIIFFTFLSLLRERSKHKPIIGYNPDGLEMSDIRAVQSLYKKNKLGFDEIKISKTIPLAPILLFGVLLTYFLKDSFINLFWS